MEFPTRIFIALLIGGAAGIASGYGISYALVPPNSVRVLNTPSAIPTDEPKYARMSGIIKDMDLKNKRIVLDAASPYSRGEHLVMHILFDDRSRIGFSDEANASRPELLKTGMRVNVLVRRESGDLRAEGILITRNFEI